MPTLPSGLMLALWDQALIETEPNWFSCPEGHFWYSVAAPEMGDPPFDKAQQVWTTPAHAPVPKDRDEAKRFVQVLEMEKDGSGTWRGEWLADFPKHRAFTAADKVAWDAWLRRPETDEFLDRLMQRCNQLAQSTHHAQGYLVLKDHPHSTENFMPDDKRIVQSIEDGLKHLQSGLKPFVEDRMGSRRDIAVQDVERLLTTMLKNWKQIFAPAFPSKSRLAVVNSISTTLQAAQLTPRERLLEEDALAFLNAMRKLLKAVRGPEHEILELDRLYERLKYPESALVARVRQVPSEIWFKVAKWAAAHEHLSPKQRQIAYSLGKRAASGEAPTEKQAFAGERILEKAQELGFEM